MYELAQQAYTTLGIQLTPAQLNALELYENEILKWNSRMNLTAIHKPNQIFKRIMTIHITGDKHLITFSL